MVHRSLEQLLGSITIGAQSKATLVRLLTADAQAQMLAHEREQAAIRGQLLDLRHREDHLTKAFTDRLLTFEGHKRSVEAVTFERELLEKRVDPPRQDASGRWQNLRAAIARAHTVWDIYALLVLREQRILIQAVFELLEIDKTGVVGQSLRNDCVLRAA